MKRYTRNLLLAALITGLSLTAGVVWAGPKLFAPEPISCPNGKDCNSVSIHGMYTHDRKCPSGKPA